MKVIDVLKGTGVGVAADIRKSVQYEFLVYEKNEVTGWVLPTFGVWQESLTLQMQDGIMVHFHFVDNNGTASVREIIRPKIRDN
jgi:hypothetical protein